MSPPRVSPSSWSIELCTCQIALLYSCLDLQRCTTSAAECTNSKVLTIPNFMQQVTACAACIWFDILSLCMLSYLASSVLSHRSTCYGSIAVCTLELLMLFVLESAADVHKFFIKFQPRANRLTGAELQSTNVHCENSASIQERRIDRSLIEVIELIAWNGMNIRMPGGSCDGV